ncbi:MAG: esterase [Leifsonia sp.]|nr:esterase [Leifsonia sp.]
MRETRTMGFLDRLLRRPPRLYIAHDSDEGPGDDRPVVVLVHGLASSSVTFDNLVPLLEPDYRCIAIDLLGFGRSPIPEHARYTLDEHTAALRRTIRSLRLRRPFTLVGHSLGSLISARYAARRRDEVDHLVMVGPPVYLPPAAMGDPADRASMGLYFAAYQFLRTNREFTTRAADVLASIAPIDDVLEVSPRNWTPFVLSLENAIESQTSLADLADVTAPVDIVHGTLDPFIAPGGLKIVSQLRKVTMTRVSGMDHLIRPKLARAVERVIREHR